MFRSIRSGTGAKAITAVEAAPTMMEPETTGTGRSTSTPQGLRSGAAWLASATPEVQAAFLESLSAEALAALPWLFEFWALPHQLPPAGDWRAWVILGGRGAGKTRAGAEWVRAQVEGAGPFDEGRCRRIALVGETIDQAREVMVFGDSGILSCTPPDRRPEWKAGRRRLEWPNGAVAEVFSASDPEALRGPQFDGAWVDEMGCAAIDKGTNQPNRFLDPKSAESGLPHFSDGTRDDLVQAQYLRAVTAHFAEAENNPISAEYGGPMVDMSRAHAWAWDARPFPYFPGRVELWSDGANYARGHWLNGRVTSESLPAVVAELCLRSGVALDALDLGALYGLVRGYTVAEVTGARAAIQPLMLAFGFDAVERAGRLRFSSRTGVAQADVSRDGLAVTDDLDGDIELVRAPAAETSGRVRLNYVETNGDYETQAAEAIFPGETSRAVAQSELPLALTAAEAQGIVERWLAESRVARDTARFALPPSLLALGAGDVVTLPTEGRAAGYRVDRVEHAGAQIIEAVRVEPNVYVPSDAVDEPMALRPFVAPLPVYPLFLDLPLMTGDEVPHAPHIAVTGQPWPGSVAVYDSSTGESFALNGVISTRATIGVTQTPLEAARPGTWDRGAPLRVLLSAGTLASAAEAQVFAGANAMAIGDGSTGNWEIFQFAEAELVGERTWELSRRLRGQLGSDGLMPAAWPAGSQVVLLDGALEQIELQSGARRLSRHYRIGPAARPYSDLSFVARQDAFDGIGLRPYAPVHLRAREAAGDLAVSWIRRTRSDGDGWDGMDVPLGEASEAYLLRVVQGGAVVREEVLAAAGWLYDASTRSADGVLGPFEIQVAQLSDRYGPGLFGKVEIDG